MSLAQDHEDLAARAMSALEQDLVLPPDLEERMLEAIALPERVGDEAAPASDVAPPPSLIAPRSRGPLKLIAAVVAAAAIVAAFWLAQGTAKDLAIDRDRAAEAAAVTVVAIDWKNEVRLGEHLASLDELRAAISGPASREATARLAPRYVDGVRKAFLDAAATELGARALRGDRDAARAYLLLGDPERLKTEGAWLADVLADVGLAVLSGPAGVPREDLRAIVRRQAGAWIFLVETRLAPPLPLDPAAFAAAQRAL